MDDTRTGREEARAAFEALMRAAALIDAWRPQPEGALHCLEPFLERNGFEGLSEAGSQRLAGMMAAVAGDCYREMGQLPAAAAWYRRAWQLSSEVTGICYVDMVIRHRMAEDYEHALAWWRQSSAAWRATPLCTRVMGHVLTWWQWLKRPWNIREYWSLQHRAKSFEATLETLMAQGAPRIPPSRSPRPF
jgi:tetratricopeptide (TPR) repeat protein